MCDKRCFYKIYVYFLYISIWHLNHQTLSFTSLNSFRLMASSVVSVSALVALVMVLEIVNQANGGLMRFTSINRWLKVACIAENMKVRKFYFYEESEKVYRFIHPLVLLLLQRHSFCKLTTFITNKHTKEQTFLFLT